MLKKKNLTIKNLTDTKIKLVKPFCESLITSNVSSILKISLSIHVREQKD